MGAGKSKNQVVSTRKYRQELESDRGGFGNLLEKQKGEKYEGYFMKRPGQNRITPDGLIFLLRNQAKRQAYSGFYRNEELCTGQMLYSGEVENPDFYIGTQNEFTREGFGEYSESGTWSYVGFWKNGNMNGFGRLTQILAKESFTGVFFDNQIQGWGQYQKVKTNKVLKPKGSKKSLQGRETTTIWSLFNPTLGNTSDKHKIIKTEDSMNSYLAFPRLQQIFFDARHTTRYILQLCTEYNGEVVNIRRRGANRYEVNYLNSIRPPQQITRNEVIRHEAYQQFYNNCKQLLEDSFDPNFTYNEITYSVEKVYFIGGMKSRYLVTCDVEDDGLEITGRYTMPGDRNIRYIVKGYIVANQMEINSHRHELKMYKLAQIKNLTPELGSCHNEGHDEDIILNYHNIEEMHRVTKKEAFPKKYMILTKHLHTGEFMDAILGFRVMKKYKVLKPFQRLILVQKIIEAYAHLEALGIYHGQVYPCHIYVDGLYREENIEDCTIKLIDFSEAVYIKDDGKEYPSRFEAALLRDPLEARRNSRMRFYVHRNYRSPRKFRLFQHPLFSYYASQHQYIPLGKLFFDIRATDQYSLLVNLLILLAPSLTIQEIIKRKLELHAQEYAESYGGGSPSRSLSRRKSFLEKDNIVAIEEILAGSYSSNSEITLQIKHLVNILTTQMEGCTPDIRTRANLDEVCLKFDDLKMKCNRDLGQLIMYFRDNEFRVPDNRREVTAEDEIEELHKTIANRILGALQARYSLQEAQEGKRQTKESIFDRFFGQQWKRPDQDVDEDEKEVDSSFIRHGQLPPLHNVAAALTSHNSDTFSADFSINDDVYGIQRGRNLTKKLNFPVNLIREEEHASDRGIAMAKAMQIEGVVRSPQRVRSTMAIHSGSQGSSPGEDFKQFRKFSKTKKGYIGIGSRINEEKEKPIKDKRFLSPKRDATEELLMVHNISKLSPRHKADQLHSPKRDFPFSGTDKYGEAVFGSTREVKIEEDYDENNLTDGDEHL